MKLNKIIALVMGVTAIAAVHAKVPAMSKMGGFVIDPSSYKGSIVFVNAQTAVPESEIDKVVSNIVSCIRFNIKVVKGTKPAPIPTAADVKSSGGNVAVFVVDDNSLPSLLVAPEDCWSVVNIGKLKEGLADDALGKRMLSVRARGELMRGFLMATGCHRSQYNNNLMDIVKVTDLDTRDPDQITFDAIQKSSLHLKNIGVTPSRRVLYRQACREGWAPSPTNDAQKAIWEKIKTDKERGPTRPITIPPPTK